MYCQNDVNGQVNQRDSMVTDRESLPNEVYLYDNAGIVQSVTTKTSSLS